MIILGLDVETTGLHDRARVAQLAMILMEDQKIIGQFECLIKPEHWSMPEETAKFHGITQELLLKYGIPMAGAMRLLNIWINQADVCIAHNFEYDHGRLKFEALQHKMDLAKPKSIFCTAIKSTDHCKIPPTESMKKYGHGNKFKKPNLQEAHTFFTGAGFDGAHSAMPDVQACMKVYHAIIEREKTNENNGSAGRAVATD